jgi:hypothetical protein
LLPYLLLTYGTVPLHGETEPDAAQNPDIHTRHKIPEETGHAIHMKPVKSILNDPKISTKFPKYSSTISDMYGTVFVRISVTFSTLHSFISVKKNFYEPEHVYLTQHAHEP